MLLKNKKLIRKQLLLALHVKVGEKHLEFCVALGSALTPFPVPAFHFPSDITQISKAITPSLSNACFARNSMRPAFDSIICISTK